MSGLTKIGKEILDFHDSGMRPDVISVVLHVPIAVIDMTIRRYAGTADHHDVLDELLPDCLRASAPADGHL